MNIKKSVFSLAFIAYFGISLFAQNRYNSKNISFEKNSQTLSRCVGWFYDKDESKWSCFYNAIYNGNFSKKPKMLDIETQSNIPSSCFIIMQVKSLIYNHKRYYILNVLRMNGVEKYPDLNLGWDIFQEKIYYIISEFEYSKLRNLHEGINKVAIIGSESRMLNNGESENYTLRKLLSFGKSYDSDTLYVKREKKNIVRFDYPGILDNKNSDYSMYDRHIDFNYSYFETTLDNFNKLIITPQTNPKSNKYNNQEIPLDTKYKQQYDSILSVDNDSVLYKSTVKLYNLCYSQNKEDTISSIVESKPSFSGGNESLAKFVFNAIKYPVVAQENKLSGIVKIAFVVDKDGSISDEKIMEQSCEGFKYEAERIVRCIPKFIPGTYKSKTVRYIYILPIVFNINSKQ